jgi:hypothetical protein
MPGGGATVGVPNTGGEPDGGDENSGDVAGAYGSNVAPNGGACASSVPADGDAEAEGAMGLTGARPTAAEGALPEPDAVHDPVEGAAATAVLSGVSVDVGKRTRCPQAIAGQTTSAAEIATRKQRMVNDQLATNRLDESGCGTRQDSKGRLEYQITANRVKAGFDDAARPP